MKRHLGKLFVIGGLFAVFFIAPLIAGVFLFFSATTPPGFGGGNQCTDQITMVNPGQVTITGQTVTIDGVKLDGTQIAHATLIAKIGVQRGFSKRDIAIAIATAYQESRLYNLNYGDRDSLGLFQQRPSVKAWGTAAQILDPVHATNAFYDALAKIPNRDGTSMMEVAIAVQRPSRAAYESTWRWDTLGMALANQLAVGAKSTTTEQASYSPGCQGYNGGTVTADGWQAPLRGNYVITSPYNPNRYHPIFHIVRPHTGVDLAANYGTPVYAVQDGTVAMAGVDGGHGNYVLLNHGGGIQSGYAHLSGYGPGISAGVPVKSGQIIGYVGSTGSSTGNHLHFEIKQGGQFIDPVVFMRKMGVKL